MTLTPGMRRSTTLAIALLLMAAVLALPAVSPQALGVPPAGGTVIDDFNDGNVGDWSFFGGNAAGGGGGALDDRPYEGTHYLSTGWGGGGSASGLPPPCQTRRSPTARPASPAATMLT